MKNSNILLTGLAVAGLVLGASGGEIPVGGYDKPADCRVDCLIETKWGQTTTDSSSNGERCYNYYVTNRTDAAADRVGCFPVAVGQVMRYWSLLQGLDCETTPFEADCIVSDGTTVTTNRLSTLGGPYQWDQMPVKTFEAGISYATTEEQRKAVGRLLYDLAVASASVFSTNAATASPVSVLRCLQERVGRFANAEIAIFNDNNCSYSVELIKQLVLPNLDAKSPVILALTEDAESLKRLEITHAVIIDGYGYSRDKRLMLHANLGAWGNGDGWFCADEGISVEGRDFRQASVCLFNLFPRQKGSVVSGRVLDSSGRAVAGVTVRVSSDETQGAECTTDDNGVYAFVLEPGEYVVKAAQRDSAAELELTVGETASRQVDVLIGDDRYWDDLDHKPLFGNSSGNDLRLPGLYTVSAEAPTVLPADGERTISGVTSVTLSCVTPDAVIRYTLDGGDPTLQSPIYTGPFTICDSITVKAIAFARNMNPSAMVTAQFVYDENAPIPAGDDRNAPMTLTGTNVTRTVNKYYRYKRANDDPIVDLAADALGPGWNTESHDAWFRWTAPGTGAVHLVGAVKGPSEWGYNVDEYGGPVMSPEAQELIPSYGICLVVYEENEDGTLGAVKASTQSATGKDKYGPYADPPYMADNEFFVVQGRSYLIQVVCPMDLVEDYRVKDGVLPWPCYYKLRDGGDSSDDESYYGAMFNSLNAYLSLSLTSDLTVNPPSPAQLTVPELEHASVNVSVGGTSVLDRSGSLQLSPNVSYTVSYAAQDNYAFEDGKAIWSVIVRDDTGRDFSVADLDGFPTNGPQRVWIRPTKDDDVREKLEENGFRGTVLQNVKTVEAFESFVEYIGRSAKGAASSEDLEEGHLQNAYLCYRLDAESIPLKALTPEDVTIAASTVQADGSLALELKIEGVAPGSAVSSDVIQELVSAEGGDDPSNLKAGNVTLSGEGVADGKVRVNVKPNATHMGERPAKFFTRLRLMQ